MRKKQKNAKIVFRRWTRTSYAVFSSLGKTVKIGVLGVGMLGLCHQPVLAQKESDTLGMSTKHLDDVVISGERPEAFQPIVEVVAVLTQKDVERAAVQNLSDLLTYLQGVDVRSRNREGVQADISLRGGTFDQVAILLNGINFTDPQTGHFNLNLPIDLQSIERIEILQGPGAWSAGNIAFSGAINIVTKTATDGSSASIHLSGGAHNYSNMGFSGVAKLNRLEITGTRGRVVIEKNTVSFIRNEIPCDEFCRTSDKAFAAPEIWSVQIPVSGTGGQHAEIMRNFAATVAGKEKLIAPAEEGIFSVELANAMLFSSGMNKEVQLPLDGAEYELFLKELGEKSTYIKQVCAADISGINQSF